MNVFESHFLLLNLFFLLSNTVGGVAGFGSVVLGLALSAHFFPIMQLIPIVVPVALANSVYIVARYSKDIDWKLYLQTIFPLTTLGFIIGSFTVNLFDAKILKNLFGLFVLVFAIWQLTRLLIKVESQKKPGPFSTLFFLIMGGILQGFYSSGGPMVVSWATQRIQNKHVFRSTLSMLWLILNTAQALNLMREGKITQESLVQSAWLLPSIVLGVWFGDLIHDKVSPRAFRIFVFTVLTISGLLLLWS